MKRIHLAVLLVLLQDHVSIFQQQAIILPVALAQTPVSDPIQSLLKAHNAWPQPPASVRITATSTRDGVTEPLAITATRQEELLLEYGARRRVATSNSQFEERGGKLLVDPAPPGFAQLDITSVFLLAQLAGRPVQIESLGPSSLEGVAVRRVRIRGGRRQIHYRRHDVQDEAELYVNETGLLAGISRSFYANSPFRVTLAFAFSDYRDTNGVLLPYRIAKYLKGRKIETISVISYLFDAPAAPALFEPRRLQ